MKKHLNEQRFTLVATTFLFINHSFFRNQLPTVNTITMIATVKK